MTDKTMLPKFNGPAQTALAAALRQLELVRDEHYGHVLRATKMLEAAELNRDLWVEWAEHRVRLARKQAEDET